MLIGVGHANQRGFAVGAAFGVLMLRRISRLPDAGRDFPLFAAAGVLVNLLGGLSPEGAGTMLLFAALLGFVVEAVLQKSFPSMSMWVATFVLPDFKVRSFWARE